MQPQNKQGAPNDTGVTDYGKCLETGKRQNPLNTESVLKQGKKQQNCLKTGEKQQNFLLAKKNVTNRGHRMTRGSLIAESVWKQGNDKIP